MKQAASHPRGLTRRALLRLLGAAAACLGAALPRGRADAAELPHLDVKDPAALAQAYVEHAADLDPKKQPAFVPGTSCENCLQLQGTAGNNYRPCSLFPGKLVSVSGWCKGWTAEM